MLGQVAHQDALDQGLGAALQVAAQGHQTRALADGEEALDHVGHGHLAEGLEGVVAGLARDQGGHAARHLGGAVEAVQGIDAGGGLGEGGVEVDEARRLPRGAAGALSGVPEVLIALGVDDDHRLPAQHGLGDQQIEEPALPGARGPDHEEVAFGVHEGQAHHPLAGAETVDPVRAEARSRGTDQPRRADAQEVVHELGMLPGPVEAPAEPEVLAAARLGAQGRAGR